jgi:hypothetical protein
MDNASAKIDDEPLDRVLASLSGAYGPRISADLTSVGLDSSDFIGFPNSLRILHNR